jgi:nitroreductase
VDSNHLEVDSLRREALRLLLGRHSISPKHLGEPGPTNEELRTVALAALRAPDHTKLVPFRFVIARDGGLLRLADLFIDYGRRRGKSGDDLEAERMRAMQAPVVIAVVARIDMQNPDVPAHEQWACVGGAISNAVLALHMLGYGAKMLSGVRAADPSIASAYCREGETLVGWISTGTARVGAKSRDEINPDQVISSF